MLVGLKSSLENLGVSPYSGLTLPPDSTKIGAGYLLAFAALLVLAAGVVLGGRAGSRADGQAGPADDGRVGAMLRRRAEPPEGDEPLELTVTSVPPTFQ